METVIAAVVVLAILGLAAGYLIRAKKKGEHCVGCPYSKTCASAKKGGCGHC